METFICDERIDVAKLYRLQRNGLGGESIQRLWAFILPRARAVDQAIFTLAAQYTEAHGDLIAKDLETRTVEPLLMLPKALRAQISPPSWIVRKRNAEATALVRLLQGQGHNTSAEFPHLVRFVEDNVWRENLLDNVWRKNLLDNVWRENLLTEDRRAEHVVFC